MLDTGITVNKVTFDHDIGSSPTYVVAGAGELSLQSKTGGTPLPAVDVLQGDHQFQAAIRLEDNTTVTVDASSVLDFNNQINLNGMDLDTTGGAGTVNINHSTVGGGSITAAGVLGTAGSTNIGGSLSSSGTLAIDLGLTRTDRFDVTGAATVSGTLSVALEPGFTPTSDVTILTASSVDTTGLTLDDPSGTFSSFDSSSGNSIVLKLASSSIDGDYDDSGQVGQTDLDLVLLNWGAAVPPTPTNPVPWVNQIPTDGQVNQNDLDGVLLNWGNTVAAGAATAVPEPTTATMLLLAAVACMGRGRARK